MKKERSILEELEDFLNYLAQNSHDKNKRKVENLKRKFGEENYKKIYSLIGGRKTGMLSDSLYINEEGLKYLEEQNQKKVLIEHNKTTLYLTAILVLTTILSAFLGIKLTNPILLVVIYGIVTIILTIIFKKNKIIKV